MRLGLRFRPITARWRLLGRVASGAWAALSWALSTLLHLSLAYNVADHLVTYPLITYLSTPLSLAARALHRIFILDDSAPPDVEDIIDVDDRVEAGCAVWDLSADAASASVAAAPCT